MCIYFLPKHNCVHKCMCFMNHFSTYFQKNYFIDYLKHKLHAHMRSHINGCTQTHVDICVYANADTSTTEVVVLERHACLHSPKLLLSCAGTIRTYLYIHWHMRTSHSDNPASLGKSLYAHTHTHICSSDLSPCIFCHVCSIMNFYTNKYTKTFCIWLHSVPPQTDIHMHIPTDLGTFEPKGRPDSHICALTYSDIEQCFWLLEDFLWICPSFALKEIIETLCFLPLQAYILFLEWLACCRGARRAELSVFLSCPSS